MEMAKAEESLNAAELCYAQGFYNSSTNRAYYAMFQAAQVALETAGFMQPEWSHACLHATFANELTRRRKQFVLCLPVTSLLFKSYAILPTTVIISSAPDRLHVL